MSFNKNNNPSTMGKIMGMLRQISIEKDDRKPRNSEGRLGGLAIKPGKGYSRVPSKGTISTSTTSTSLVTDYTGSHTHLYLPKTLLSQDHYPEEYLEEEEQSLRGDDEDAALTQDEEQEDFEQIRKHFQQLRQTSLGSANKYKMEMETKEENLRNTVPYVKSLSRSKNLKDDEFILDADPSPYTPTTQNIYIMTQTVAALAVSLGSLVIGYTSAYTSPALVTMVHENSTVQVTKDEGSWVGGLMPLAALFGGVIGGPLIEKFGRRSTILAISVPFIISWVIIALASNVSIIYTGRALSGICVGVGSLSFPVYLGEVLQPEVRGKLGLLPTAFGNIGILICFIVGKYVNWSELAWLGAALPVPFLVMMLFVPETPRWLISHSGSQDKKETENLKKARRALRWLKGNNANVEDELNELNLLNNEGKKNATGSALSELFKREYARSILISLGLMLFQQMSGINAVIFYTVTIFKEAESSIDGNLCTIIVGIVNFISTFIATGLIESLGRKILLYISGVAMFLTLMILGFFFYFQNVLQYDVTSFGWLPLASFIIYVIGFSLGFGPIPWLMMGEILPARIRGTAASLITAFNWACTFFVTKTFLSMIEDIGIYGAFWMYGTICLFGLIFTFLCVPETKGKSLEEIEELLSGKRRLTSDSDIAEKERMEC